MNALFSERSNIKLKSLIIEHFEDNALFNQCVQNIFNALHNKPDLNLLENLKLYKNNLNEETLAIIIGIGHGNTHLQNLHLLGCNVPLSALNLHLNPQIIDLELRNNNIHDKGVEIIARALENPENQLTVLDLSRNPITNEGIKFLFHALEQNPDNKLKELYLMDTKIDDNGLNIRFPSKLSEVDLSKNSKITHVGLNFFFQSIKENSNNQLSILYLDLSTMETEYEQIYNTLSDFFSDENCHLKDLYGENYEKNDENKIKDQSINDLAKTYNIRYNSYYS